MHKKKQGHAHGFWEGFLIGSTLGAMTTFVVGTKKGNDLRKALLKKYHQLGPKMKHLQHYLSDAQKRVMKSHLFQHAKKMVTKKVRSLKRLPLKRKAKR